MAQAVDESGPAVAESPIGLVTGADSDAAWARLGRTDPYFGVLSDAKFHADRLSEETRVEFFATGARHVEAVFRVVRARLVPEFQPRRALDFGCGVGRIVIALAERCDRVVGVDVSGGMLAEARRQSEARKLANVEFARTNDAIDNVQGPFDFIHSYIVFQHIPAARQERILARLADLLEAGGVGVVHCLYRRPMSATGAFAYWARKNVPFANGLFNVLFAGQPFGTPFMQMNPADLATTFETLRTKGCGDVHVEFTNHGTRNHDVPGVILFFRKVALPAW